MRVVRREVAAGGGFPVIGERSGAEMMPDTKTYQWFYDRIHSHYYDLLAKWCYLPFGGEGRCRAELIAQVDALPGEVVLDSCCGTGGATRAIVRKAASETRVVGMDLSSGQLRKARRRRELRAVPLVQGDAARTSFRDRSFDKVFIAHAVHEMSRRMRLTVLTETRRILKDDGTVIVVELDDPASPLIRLFIGLWFFYWLPFNFETPTRRDMLRHGLAREVREAGFRDVTKRSTHRGVFQTVQGRK